MGFLFTGMDAGQNSDASWKAVKPRVLVVAHEEVEHDFPSADNSLHKVMIKQSEPERQENLTMKDSGLHSIARKVL